MFIVIGINSLYPEKVCFLQSKPGPYGYWTLDRKLSAVWKTKASALKALKREECGYAKRVYESLQSYGLEIPRPQYAAAVIELPSSIEAIEPSHK